MKVLLVLVILLASHSVLAQSDIKWIRTSHEGFISSLSFSSNGKYLVTTGVTDDEIIVWDGATGKFDRRVKLPGTQHANYAEFLPNTTIVAVGCDKRLSLYDLETRKVTYSLSRYETQTIHRLFVSTTGDTISWVMGRDEYSRPNKLYVFDLKAKKIFDSLPVVDYYSMYERSPNDWLPSKDLLTYVFRDGGSNFVFDLRRGTVLRIDDPNITAREIGADGRYIIFDNDHTQQQDSLSLPDYVMTEGVRQGLQGSRDLDGSTFSVQRISPGGGFIALAMNRFVLNPEYDENYGYLYMVRGSDTTLLSGLAGEFEIAPTGDTMFVGSDQGSATYALDGSLRNMRTMSWQYWGIQGIHYSPTGVLSYAERANPFLDPMKPIYFGDRVASYYFTMGSNPICWNTPQVDPTGTLGSLGLSVFSLDTASSMTFGCPLVTSEWHPSGSHYVWSEYNDTLVLQERTGERRYILTGHRRISEIAISSDGAYIATCGADSVVRVWNIEGQLLKQYVGHTGAVNSIDFAPESRFLVSGSVDATIRVWDIDRGEVYRYTEFPEVPQRVRVSPDGKTVVVLSHDGDREYDPSDRTLVGYNAQEWADVRTYQQTTKQDIQAWRSGDQLTIERTGNAKRNWKIDVIDLLGRTLITHDYSSSELSAKVSLSQIGKQPLVVVMTVDGETTSTIVP